MRFAAHRAQALSRSRRLSYAFAAVLVAVVVFVNLAGVLLAMLFSERARWADSWAELSAALPPFFLATNTGVALLMVLGGAWLEAARLRGGGVAVARGLGARELSSAPQDPRERQLAHIADEMAIAAAMPTPRLFVIDRDESINACVAGHEPRDAAVMVTRGALERLSRDELQGVYAHEYSHVLNGDIALNMRLAAFVRGVLLMHEFGRWLSGVGQSVPQDPRDGLPLLHPLRWLVGGAVMMVGSVGWLAASLLHASVGREREFLADATAVRLTRLAEGLGNALRKLRWQSEVGETFAWSTRTPGQFAHLWIGSVGGRHGWFASHPPLRERIRRVLGHDAGPLEARLLAVDDEIRAPASAQRQLGSGAVGLAGASAPSDPAFEMVDQASAPAQALGMLQRRDLPDEVRLRVFRLALGALDRADAEVREDCLRKARALISADGGLGLLEFALFRLMLRQLGQSPESPAPSPSRRRPVKGAERAEASAALSVLLQGRLGARCEAAEAIWGMPILPRAGVLRAVEALAALRTIEALGPLDQALAVKALAVAQPEAVNGSQPAAWLQVLCGLWGVPLPV